MLFLNTLAFTTCFAAWMLNGVLVTYLVDHQVFNWGPVEVGWLLGIPVLTGSIFRLPLGMLTDRYGGRPVFTALLLFCSIPMYLLSEVNSFAGFAAMSFGFGIIGTGFAVGIAFTSVWYPKRQQGLALGVFGAGNAGAALTTLFAPTLLMKLTAGGTDLEGWRMLPRIYAACLVAMAVIFFLFTTNRRPEGDARTMRRMLEPLRTVRVWRFGLYYFLVFGCFVAFAQWLVPYYVNVYAVSLVTAGVFASMFSFPSGVIRALGGWLSDRWGARKVMYWVLGSSVAICLLLVVPRMEVTTPGKGVMSTLNGRVTYVSDTLVQVNGTAFAVRQEPPSEMRGMQERRIWPTKRTWQNPVVQVGDEVRRKQSLAQGITRIHFSAHMMVFTVLVILVGIVWGIGKAAVYKHIPEYFPDQVGVVGGMVGVLGGLGGFLGPILFGYLLEATGLWTSSWLFLLLVSLACLLWMNHVVNLIQRRAAPEVNKTMEVLRIV